MNEEQTLDPSASLRADLLRGMGRWRFKLLRPHAQGGLGQVSVALDMELNREVAFKAIRPERQDDVASRARFVIEGEVTGALEHPGIVPVYSLGVDEQSRPYYAMRFIRGSSLEDAIKDFHAHGGEAKRSTIETHVESGLPAADGLATTIEVDSIHTLVGPNPALPVHHISDASGAQRGVDFTSLEFRKLLRRFLDVCNAVAYAHSRGVIHRDLKPANIMLGPYGETLVVDWGLAKSLGKSAFLETNETGEPPIIPASGAGAPETIAGAAIGTPSFMSPEQALGRLDEVGPASDTYSLGATLYAMLTNQAPFTGRDGMAILQNVVRGDFTRPRKIQEAIPKQLEAIVLKAMAADVTARYASVNLLAEDLEHYLADEPIAAMRDPFADRVRRWMRKHRTLASSAAAVLVVAVCATALTAAQQSLHVRAMDQKNQTLTDTNLALAQQRKKAELREQTAIDAVNRFRTAVAENPELKNNPDLDELRKTLLKEPLAFFKTLRDQLQSDQDTSPQSLARLASANYELAVLTSEIGDKSDALRSNEQAELIYEKLTREHPADGDYAVALAKTRVNQGLLKRETGNLSGARESLEEALRFFAGSGEDATKAPLYPLETAKSCNNLASLLNDGREHSKAKEYCERSLAILEKLSREQPEHLGIAHELAIAHNTLGNVQCDTRDLDGARKAFERTLDLMKGLLNREPKLEYAQGVAATSGNLGRVLEDAGESQAAREAYQQAVDILKEIVGQSPTVTQYTHALATVQTNLAGKLAADRDWQAAQATYEQALANYESLVRKHPTIPSFGRDQSSTHYNIGNMLRDRGDLPGATAAFERAIANSEALMAAHPTLREIARELGQSYNNLGVVRRLAGDSAGALRAYSRALTIRSKLASDDPRERDFVYELSVTQHNLATVLMEAGELAEAKEAHQSALAIRKKLVREHPEVPVYSQELSRTILNLSRLCQIAGDLQGALRENNAVIGLRRKLAREHPTVSEYASELAIAYINRAQLLQAASDLLGAGVAFDAAIAIYEKLVQDKSNIPQYAGKLSVPLFSRAVIELTSGRTDDALIKIAEAIDWQKAALAANPESSQDRLQLEGYLNTLQGVAQQLGRGDVVADAQRQLADLVASDPQRAALDARLNAVIGGEALKDDAEGVALAKRAYERASHVAAVKLWMEVFAGDPSLVDDRESQHRYNAACSAVLAASGMGKDEPSADDDTKAGLREQARSWLEAELAAWSKLLDSANAPQRIAIEQTISHWQTDPDLATVRDKQHLESLSPSDRDQWDKLWSSVEALRASAANEK